MEIITLAQYPATKFDAGSKVEFTIKNFGIKTNGSLSGLNGVIKFDPENLETSFFKVTVDSKSINTNNNLRDNHLKKSEYFDVEKFKTIEFKSTKLTKTSLPGRYNTTGVLTIKGVSKQISFDFVVNEKQGLEVFEGEFEINRRDFGIGGSSMTLADNLQVHLSVIVLKQQ